MKYSEAEEAQQQAADLFLKLFDGNRQNHIELSGIGGKTKSNKTKAKCQTVNGPLTQDMALDHLHGRHSIGVSPVRSDGTCMFGVLDFDIYEMSEDDVELIRERIKTRSVAFRSKSNGLHIYVFMDEPVAAKSMHDYLVMLRKRMPKKWHSKIEIFPPRTQTTVSPDMVPTGVNLPMFGKARTLAWMVDGADGHVFAYDETSRLNTLKVIEERGRMQSGVMLAVANAQPETDTSDIGYKVPDDPAGRNDLLMRIARSMQARGWPDDELSAELFRLNREGANFHDVFQAEGPLTESEIKAMIKTTLRLEKGSPSPLHYRVVEKFNREWAVMRVGGKVEFLNKDEDVCYPKADFMTVTAPLVVGAGNKAVPMSSLWIRDVDRHEYRGIVIESPDYDGLGYNQFRGWAVAREKGDASLWVQYVEEILCGGDKQLAHWVMSYVADGVQRPWSLHPGSALALRGGQGGGKSFLGRALRKIVGNAHAQQIAETSRMFSRFNRGLFGSTFVLCEESLFAGSKAQASTTKGFITSDVWTYEQKHLATFEAKNVHRIIATTNENQAVHIDNDDRRWTVIEVQPPKFDDAHGPEARKFWQPYYDLVDNHAGVILDYLMEYDVDRDLIGYGCLTDAKREDKSSSDALLDLLDEIAFKGVCPDDLRGMGTMSASTIHREYISRGGARLEPRRRLTKRLIDNFGATRDHLTTHIYKWITMKDGDGFVELLPEKRDDMRGVQLPPLSEFRAIVGRITGAQYPDGGEWEEYTAPTPATTPDLDRINGGDAKKAKEQWIRENGDYERVDVPF